jgi:hypothetical protein
MRHKRTSTHENELPHPLFSEESLSIPQEMADEKS